ncbi:hypothetical protein GQX74_015732, partial [Glossina fuscipes]
GVCEKTIQDVVERFWDIIEEININRVLRFLKDNIVMVIVIITSVIWIPASCIISYFDRKKFRYEMKQVDWSQKLDLIHPSARRRVIHIRLERETRFKCSVGSFQFSFATYLYNIKFATFGFSA